jgi:hypothetical protein
MVATTSNENTPSESAPLTPKNDNTPNPDYDNLNPDHDHYDHDNLNPDHDHYDHDNLNSDHDHPDHDNLERALYDRWNCDESFLCTTKMTKVKVSTREARRKRRTQLTRCRRILSTMRCPSATNKTRSWCPSSPRWWRGCRR